MKHRRNCLPEQATDRDGSRFQLETELARDLGLVAATTIIVGGIIGSGIFAAPAEIAAALGSPELFLLVWVVGGLLCFSGALCFAELGAMMPRTGGIIVYLRESYPPFVSYLYGWTEASVICPGALAAIAMIFSTYLGHFVPGVSMENVLVEAGRCSYRHNIWSSSPCWVCLAL